MGTVSDIEFNPQSLTTPNLEQMDQIFELNSVFLNLLAELHQSFPIEDTRILGLDRCYVERLIDLSEDARRRIAKCGYSLFTFNLTDRCLPTGIDVVCEPASGPFGHSETLSAFARSALTAAWMMTRTAPLIARTVLDLSAGQCRALAALTPVSLDDVRESAHLMIAARLAGNPRFWPDLIELAQTGSEEQFEAARLAGVQQKAVR